MSPRTGWKRPRRPKSGELGPWGGRFRAPREERRDDARGLRACEEVALNMVASGLPDGAQLSFELDALGDNGQAEGVGRVDHEAHELAGAGGRGLDEALVDLEGVDGEVLQLADRGVAGAEVVDANPDAEFPNGAQVGDGRGLVDQHGLGDFQDEASTGHIGCL
jgi:hypothetical protein